VRDNRHNRLNVSCLNPEFVYTTKYDKLILKLILSGLTTSNSYPEYEKS